MRPLALFAASALALAQGLCAGQAQEAAIAADRFRAEVVVGPKLTIAAPTSPAYALGVGEIRDAMGQLIDPLTTGQIPNRDAEKAAGGLNLGAASTMPSEPIETVDPEAPAEPRGADAAAPHAEPGHQAAPAEAAHGTDASQDAAATASEGETHTAGDWATSRRPQPFDIIRTIQFLQDQISRGNGRAIQVQAMLLRRFGPVFLDAEPKVWSDPRNTRAAVLFVFSGGPPEVLRRLMAGGVLDPSYEPLFKGALAYVENDLDEAESILSGVDTKDMEPGLEAHLNLVLGQLMQADKPKEAIPRLDRARLLAPGGLVEEAALRMEVMLVDGLGDHAAADRLARQYFDRFSASSYSANFEARFAAVYSTRGGSDAPAAMATMLDVTERLPDANRLAIFLSVSRRALVEGHLAFAELAARAARETNGITPADSQRARLYVIAATIAASSSTRAADELAAIDPAILHPEDVKLLVATRSILDGIDRLPEIAEAPASSGEYAETSPVFGRAEQLLNEVAGDLGKVQP